ncbi:MAG TPA: hypothetical protein VJT31_20390 [Rugosimonospora sp.]|nr:hypothetical protein [Rugosimonospora sp.]
MLEPAATEPDPAALGGTMLGAANPWDEPEAPVPARSDPQRHQHPQQNHREPAPATADLMASATAVPAPADTDWAAPVGEPPARPEQHRAVPVLPVPVPTSTTPVEDQDQNQDGPADEDGPDDRVAVVELAGSDDDFSSWEEGWGEGDNALFLAAWRGREGDEGSYAVDYALRDTTARQHSSRSTVPMLTESRRGVEFSASVAGRLWSGGSDTLMCGGSDEDLDRYLAQPQPGNEEADEAQRQMLDLLRQENRAWGNGSYLPGVVE